MAFSNAGRLPAPAEPAAPAEPSLLFVGGVFCDLVFRVEGLPEPGGEVFADRFAVTAGGTANRAVAAARLGVRSALSARIGSDPLGTTVLEQLAAESNLDLSGLRVDDSFQTPITVSLAHNGDRSFITYEEDPGAAPSCQAAGKGSISACHVSASGPLPAGIAELQAAGTVVVGGVGWDGTGTWSSELLRNIENVDVFCANAVEAMNYTRLDDPAAAASELAHHVPISVVTLGADGVIAVDQASGRRVRVPGIRVPVADPTGAGDVFVAALMVGIHLHWPLEEQLKLATAASAVSVGRLGGARAAPSPAEIAQLLTTERPAGDWSSLLAWTRHRTHTLEGQ